MIRVVQIKGSNGSGKTSLVKGLLYPETLGTGYGSTILKYDGATLTANPYTTWLAVGTYEANKTHGGCDTLRTVAEIKHGILQAIKYAMRHEYYGVAFEGMMISTIKTTFYNYLLELAMKYPIEPVFVILDVDVNNCLKRLKGRGTIRPNLNVDNVAGKCDLVRRHAREYNPQYVVWIDANDQGSEEVLYSFLRSVDDMELVGMLWHS